MFNELFESFIKEIIKVLQKTYDCEQVCLYLQKDNEGKIYSASWNELFITIDEKICKSVLDKKNMIFIQDNSFNEKESGIIKHYSSLIAFPIVNYDENNDLYESSFFLADSSGNKFTAEDKELLIIVSKLIYYGITNYFTRTSNSEMEDSNYSSGSFQKVLSEEFLKIIKYFNGDMGTLYRFDKETQNFYMPIAHGVSNKFWLNALPRKYGIARYIIKNSQKLFVSDISNDPLFSNSLFSKDEGVKSIAAISLLDNGIMYINYTKSNYKFSVDEKNKIIFIGEIIGLVLRSFNIVEKYDWGKLEGTDIQHWSEIIREFFEKKLIKISKVDAVTLYLYDKSHDLFHLITYVGVKNSILAGRVSKTGIVYALGMRNEPSFFNDVTNSEIFQKSNFTKKEGIKSLAILPLLNNSSEFLGVIFLNFRQLKDFTKEEQSILKSVSEFLSISLDSILRNEDIYRVTQILGRLHKIKIDESTLKQSLQLISDGISYFLKSDSSLVLIYNQKEKKLEIGGYHGITSKDISNFTSIKGTRKNILDNNQKENVKKNDLEAEDPDDPFFEIINNRTVCHIPLMSANEVVGILSIGFKSSNHIISDNDYALIEILKGEATQRITNYLYEMEVKLKNQQLEYLLEVTKALHSQTTELDELLSKLVNIIIPKLGFKRAILSRTIFKEDDEYLERIAFVNVPIEEQQELKKEENWLNVNKVQEEWFKSEYKVSNSYYIPYPDFQKIKNVAPIVSIDIDYMDEKENEWHKEDFFLIPLYHEKRLKGLLSVGEPFNRSKPTEEEAKILELFVEHIILAIINSDQNTKRINENITTTYLDKKIIEYITNQEVGYSSINDLLSSMIEIIKNQIKKIDYIDIFIKSGNKLSQAETYYKGSKSDNYLGQIEFDIDSHESIVAHVAQKSIPILIKNIENNELHNIYSQTYPGMKAELAVPILLDKYVVGVINLESKTRGAFNVRDQELLERIALQFAIIVELIKTRLEIEVLNKTERLIGNAINIEEISKSILNEIIRFSGADYGIIGKWNKEESNIEYLSSYNIKRLQSKIDKGIEKLLSEKGEGLYIPDLDDKCGCGNCTDGTWRKNHFNNLIEDTSKSLLVIAIIVASKVFGMIIIESKTEDAFKGNIRLIVAIITHQIGAAFEKTLERNKLIKTNQEMALLSVWDYLGKTLLHNIVGSLSTITLRLDSIKLHTRDEVQIEKLTIIESNIEAIQLSMKRYMFSNVTDKLDLVDILSQIEMEHEIYAQYHNGIILKITILNEHLYLNQNRECLLNIIRNMIQNSFSAIVGDGTVELIAQIVKDKIQVIIKDNGKGISDGIKKILFNSIIEKTQGLGCFLMFTKLFLEKFDSSLELVSSEVNIGTEFKLIFPLAN